MDKETKARITAFQQLEKSYDELEERMMQDFDFSSFRLTSLYQIVHKLRELNEFGDCGLDASFIMQVTVLIDRKHQYLKMVDEQSIDMQKSFKLQRDLDAFIKQMGND